VTLLLCGFWFIPAATLASSSLRHVRSLLDLKTQVRTRVKPIATGPFVQMRKQILEAIEDPRRKIITPSNTFLKDQIRLINQRVNGKNGHPAKALGVMFVGLPRAAKIVILTLVISECLNCMGIFESTVEAKRRFLQVWNTTHTNVQKVPISAQAWVNSNRQEEGWLCLSTWQSPSKLQQKLYQCQPKHQFAFGTGIGLMVSKFLWAASKRLFILGSVVYLLAEVDAGWKQWRGTSLVQKLITKMEKSGISSQHTVRVGIFLDVLRDRVRTAAKEPRQTLMHSLPEAFDRYFPDGGPPGNTQRGLLVGLAGGLVI